MYMKNSTAAGFSHIELKFGHSKKLKMQIADSHAYSCI